MVKVIFASSDFESKYELKITEAVVTLAAPRPLLCMNGQLDGGSPTDGIHAIEQKVTPIYGLYDRAGDFESTVYPAIGHEYLPEMWDRTLRWFDEKLGKKRKN